MKFIDFLAESKVSAIVESKAEPSIIIYDYKHDPVAGTHGYKEGDIIVLEDADADMGTTSGTLKFGVAPVSLKDEDPVAWEVVAADVEVEFDVDSDEDYYGETHPVFTIKNKAKVKYNIWKLDSRDIDNYTNIKATRDRFEKQLNDDLLREVAVEVIEKYEDYLSSLHDKVIGINRGY